MYDVQMNPSAAKEQNPVTWNDYRTWPEEKRWQVIAGEPYAMTPAPATRHQLLVSRLTQKMGNFFDGKTCQAYPAPTDLKLSEVDFVQPDLLVVCDPDQIKPTHVEGAPTLVIEILSPSTEQLDRGRKLDLYASAGVQEVWLVKPYPALIEILVLDSGTYRRAHAFTQDDPFTCPSFPDLELDLQALFDLPIPPEERIEVVKEGRPPYAAKA